MNKITKKENADSMWLKVTLMLSFCFYGYL